MRRLRSASNCSSAAESLAGSSCIVDGFHGRWERLLFTRLQSALAELRDQIVKLIVRQLGDGAVLKRHLFGQHRNNLFNVVGRPLFKRDFQRCPKIGAQIFFRRNVTALVLYMGENAGIGVAIKFVANAFGTALFADSVAALELQSPNSFAAAK